VKLSKPIYKAVYQYLSVMICAIFFGFMYWKQYEDGEVKRTTVAFFYLCLVLLGISTIMFILVMTNKQKRRNFFKKN